MFKRGDIYWTCIRHKGRKIQKSLETSDRRLADQIESKLKVELLEGKFFNLPKGRHKTFKELAERYLAEKTVHKAPRTQITDRMIFKLHLIPFFGDRLIGEIAAKDINEYKAKRFSEKVVSDTVNRELAVLKACFNVAVREYEWLEQSPGLRVRKEKAGKGRVRYLTKDELKALYGQLPEWLKPMFDLARFTGIRQGNLLNLEWKDVDLFRKTITLQETKNGDRHGVPINETLFEVMVGLFKRRNISETKVFTRNGKPVAVSTLGNVFRGSCKTVGIVNFRWHDLRHQFASELVQRGVNIYEVQKLLCHRNITMTMKYAHLAPENLRNAVNVLTRADYNLTTAGSRQTPALAGTD
jgi:integrase